ncbi:MAG TPA: hypothetical protein DEA08_06975 [Planctomycetes bacterium]|nr:hypothetical protein [Planctomycetota bacterium]
MTGSETLELAAFREDQVPDQVGIYLDYARRGLLLRSAREGLLRFVPSLQKGSTELAAQAETRESARRRLARLVGVTPQQLAFTSNTTTAIALLAQSVSWAPGDRVLVAPDEVASNRLPWLALESRGVVVEELPSRAGRLVLEDLARVCRERPPRWAALSLVSLSTGQLRPVREALDILHAVGAKVCVDVAQGIGVLRLPERLRGVAAVVGCGRKWLCGPPEVGFLALNTEDLSPISAGMCSLEAHGALRPGAGAWEGGVEPVLALVGLEASLETLGRLSGDTVEAAALHNAEVLRSLLGDRAKALPAEERSPIVWVQTREPVDPKELVARGLVVRPRGLETRVSAHAWSTLAELEQAAAILTRL